MEYFDYISEPRGEGEETNKNSKIISSAAKNGVF